MVKIAALSNRCTHLHSSDERVRFLEDMHKFKSRLLAFAGDFDEMVKLSDKISRKRDEINAFMAENFTRRPRI